MLFAQGKLIPLRGHGAVSWGGVCRCTQEGGQHDPGTRRDPARHSQRPCSLQHKQGAGGRGHKPEIIYQSF